MMVAGPTGTPLHRSPIGEASRVLCLDWAVRECPDALALHEALVSKAILTSLTPTDASLPIKAVGARLAAFFASRCTCGPHQALVMSSGYRPNPLPRLSLFDAVLAYP